jgi:hypothetical protein
VDNNAQIAFGAKGQLLTMIKGHTGAHALPIRLMW